MRRSPSSVGLLSRRDILIAIAGGLVVGCSDDGDAVHDAPGACHPTRADVMGPSSWWRSVTEVIAAMKTTAADKGGDAILLLDHNDSHQGGHGCTGVVIQYRAPCSG